MYGGILLAGDYANLIKASWIFTDIIANHPQWAFLSESVRLRVEVLAGVS